jgi:hypothetical protein
MSIELATSLLGAVVVENVFALPGLGSLLLQGIRSRDFPIVQDLIFLITSVVLFIGLIADLAQKAVILGAAIVAFVMGLNFLGDGLREALEIVGLDIVLEATGKTLVEGASLAIDSGERVALIGESGSGARLGGAITPYAASPYSLVSKSQVER